jgi:hypothetical protein
MELNYFELLTIQRLLDDKIKLYESWLDDEQLSNFFAMQIKELQTIKTKINERTETILR